MNALPSPISRALQEDLGCPVTASRAVHGGDIHAAYRATLGDGRGIFVKSSPSTPPGLFAAEAAGLQWLGGFGAVDVPPVLACRDAGVRVIGFTSFAYTQQVVSLHPSGLRLKDAVDIAIDIGAPYGDAAVMIEGYDMPLLPVSGVGAIMAGWMIFERVMRKMAARGAPASVFLSANREGGMAALAETHARCDAQGY